MVHYFADTVSLAKQDGAPSGDDMFMDYNLIPALSGVLGSLVGGTASVATTWITQRTLSRRELLRAEVAKREALYGEFVTECSKAILDSIERTLDKPERLLPIYELLNRIRLTASEPVLEEAERTLTRISEQYFGPNLSLEDLRDLVRSGRGSDPIRPFGEACRAELKALHTTM